MNRNILFVLPLLLSPIFSNSVSAQYPMLDHSNQPNSSKLKKEGLANPRLPDFSTIFNWGLKLTNIKELYFFSGIAAQKPNFTIVHPFNYVSQTDYILNELDIFLAQNHLTRNDIVRIEFTLVKGVSQSDFNTVLERFASYFKSVQVKPAAGTLRIVDALAFPGLVVEYEVWCAR
jgi:enamine deaminase RidA (YjgF/YER057c/UK114 family)